MKCEQCGATNQGTGGLKLECSACGLFPFDCQCYSRNGHTPKRWVHCTDCDRLYICQVNTSDPSWQAGTV